MKTKKRSFMFLTTLMLCCSVGTAWAADWSPDKPIKVWIGFRAGGSTDTLGRVITAQLEKASGWTTVVENVTGGGGGVMAAKLKKEKPDGHTIGLLVTVAISTAPVLRKNSPIAINDFDYLTTVAQSQAAIVAHADAPYTDIPSMVEYGKKKGKLTVNSFNPVFNLLSKIMEKQLGVNIKVVPTKGGSGMVKLLLGKKLDWGFSGGIHPKYVRNGQFKVLASVNSERLDASPNVKTLKEQGVDASIDVYFLFVAPSGLPVNIKATLVSQLRKAIQSNDVRSLVMDKLEMPIVSLSPEETKQKVLESYQETKKLFNQAK